jgi:predicted MFS family arabinose efflux permease
VLSRLTSTEVRAALVAVLLARTAVNAGTRLAYPFLPEIARGLGVSLATVAALFALRSAAGLAAPLVPGITETLGRRAMMLGALVMAAVGAAVVGFAPGLAVAGVGFMLLGLSKPLFDIPMQGWFGARVPYARRGRVIGTTELTWAASLALAAPAGFLIAATSWRAPFLLVAFLAVASVGVITLLIRPDRPASRERRPLGVTRVHVTLVAVVLLFRLAAELLFIVYGSWLEDDFGLSVAAIGVFTIVVVCAELAGEGGVVAFADRLGLRRTVFLGLLTSGTAYLSLGFVGGSLPLAVVAVVAWFAGFELTIVATIALTTGLANAAPERLLSFVATVAVASSGIAALLGPQLYARGGIALCGLAAAGCAAVAGALLTRVPSPSGAR